MNFLKSNPFLAGALLAAILAIPYPAFKLYQRQELVKQALDGGCTLMSPEEGRAFMEGTSAPNATVFVCSMTFLVIP